MNCNDFEANIDRYLDGALDSNSWRSALEHAARCTACDALVTSYQQASALLKTAVTDRVAAVDVSGLWDAIESQVPATVARVIPITPRIPVPVGFVERLRGWAAQLTPVRVGAAMATAAVALGLLVASSGRDTLPEPRIARAKTKAVRIEAMEVPAGYTVSTWSRPRSRTHMISINPDPTYTVVSASVPR